MSRLLAIVLFLVALAVIRVVVVPFLPPDAAGVVDSIIGGILSLACTGFWILLWVAPGTIYRLRDDAGELWERLRGRRSEIDDLMQRIHHLGKPHHMAQLGAIFQRQGRHKQAGHWFAKALEQDGAMVDARYRLALCRMREKKFQEAATLLEEVHAAKPDHDYGGAYLRLAQASELAGNDDRAAAVYPMLFKCCPGHAEGCYGYGLLLKRRGDVHEARQQMEQVLLSVRNSPTFHRRRNRHWMWKARWWLWRHRQV
jgi:tetratricopeptide (TPR) repeat protein